MNRGFAYYFREGVCASCKALFRNGHFFRYLVYFFTELIGRITLFFGLIFDMANVRQGKILRKKRQVAISPSFREAGKAGNVWTYFIAVCLEAFTFLAGLVLCALLVGALGLIGYAVSSISSDLDRDLFVMIFAIPGLLVTLVYLVITPLIFAPTPWIVANNAGITVGDTLLTCFRTMKQNGKFTLALNTLIPLLIKLVCLGVGVGGAFLWGELLAGNEWYPIVSVLWILISAAGFIVVAPIFTLTTRVANEHLFEDIVLDPVAADRHVSGVNVTRCRGQKFEISSIESNLAALFDETDSESQPVLEEIVKEAPRTSAEPAVDLSQARQTRRKKRGKSEPEAPFEAFPDALPEAFGPPAREPVAEEPEPSYEAPLAEEIPEPVWEETPEPVQESETAEESPQAEEPAAQSVAEPETQPEEELPTVTDLLGDTAEEAQSPQGETFEDIFGDLMGDTSSSEESEPAVEAPVPEPESGEEVEEPAAEGVSPEAEPEREEPEKGERKKSAASKLLSRLKKK